MSDAPSTHGIRRPRKRLVYRVLIGSMVLIVLVIVVDTTRRYQANRAIEQLIYSYGGTVLFGPTFRIAGIDFDSEWLLQQEFYSSRVDLALGSPSTILLDGSPDISPEELSSLSRVQRPLEKLELMVSGLTDDHLSVLREVEAHSLEIDARGLTATGFRHLATIANLQSLDLSHAEIDGEIGEIIATKGELRSLVLRHCTTSPEALSALSKLEVTTLVLRSLSLEQIDAIDQWPGVDLLIFWKASATNEIVARVIETFPELKELRIFGAHQLTPEFLDETFGDGSIQIFFLPEME